MKKTLQLLSLLVFIFFVSCSDDDPDSPPGPTPEPELPTEFNTSTDQLELRHEFRASWYTTVGGYDWPRNISGAEAQKSALISDIADIKSTHCNAVIMQVVSRSDAMYNSSILPWAIWLTGTQGGDPGYDPLALAITEARDKGMEIHAWINPMRIGSNTDQLHPTHPAVLHPERYLEYDGVRYWDPGLPEVHQYLSDIVTELLTNYDLDGIHIDDYFYPHGIKSDAKEWDDSQSYANYGAGMTLDEWRENNIDKLVKTLNDATHAADPDAAFGVSPSGNYNNTMALYANPKTWMANNTLDYLAPQIYWQIGHPIGDFVEWSNFWATHSNGTPILPGLAAYRLGDSSFPNMAEYKNQLKVTRSISEHKGQFWFRTAHITNANFKTYMKNNFYQYPALPAKLGASSDAVPSKPSVQVSNKTLSWSAVANANQYAVYELERLEPVNEKKWVANLIQLTDDLTFTGNSKKNYVVVAVNGKQKSPHSNVVYID